MKKNGMSNILSIAIPKSPSHLVYPTSVPHNGIPIPKTSFLSLALLNSSAPTSSLLPSHVDSSLK